MSANAVDLVAAVQAQGRDDINSIYEAIIQDQEVLEHYDKKTFVETPLHVAASFGYLQFATEIMRLKPSLAWKLNKQGFSPIHLAMRNGHRPMVYRFVEINKDLVRVKGKEGKTPLHVAAQNGETELLANFLWACPESIEDITVRSQTALHIAVINQQYDALRVLVGWLKRNWKYGDTRLERRMLNWQDNEGNTILHIAATENDLEAQEQARAQAVGTLVSTTRMNLNAKNISNLTAWDMARNDGVIREILLMARARTGQEVTDAPPLEKKLIENIGLWDITIINVHRLTTHFTEDQRNALLIVVGLLITAIYQSTLSPPGGLYQANAGDNNGNSTSHNSTATATQGKVGTSTMSLINFLVFSLVNMASLFISSVLTLTLIPGGAKTKGNVSMVFFILIESYLINMTVISPTSSMRIFNLSLAICFLVAYLGLRFLIIDPRYEKIVSTYAPKNRKIRIRNSAGRNRW